MINKRLKHIITIISALLVFSMAIIYLIQYSQKREIKEQVYRLKWLANVGFVGDLFSYTYGYFIEEGLNVKVLQGGPQNNPILEIETGAADFGVASADQIIKACERDADIVVIAQIYQKNPVQWIYRQPKKNDIIDKPEILADKKIGVTYGDNDYNIMKALMSMHSIDTTGFYSVKYSYIPFTKGSVDLFPVYKNTQGVELENQLFNEGESVGYFDPEIHGVKFVANSIITSSRKIRDEREEVVGFLKALLRGWEDALKNENKEKSIKAVISYIGLTENQDSLKSIYSKQIDVTKKLIYPDDKKMFKIGNIDKPAWRQTEELMLELGLINQKVDIINKIDESILSEVYE